MTKTAELKASQKKREWVWWSKLSDQHKAFTVLVSLGVIMFGAGLQADFLTEIPRTTRENRSMLLALDSVIAGHSASPAHPIEAATRARADSALLTAIHRGDSLIVDRLEWLICVERLDRTGGVASPSEVVRICPPPGANP